MDSKTTYSLAQFVTALRTITASVTEERDILRQVAPLAERLAATQT